MRTSHFTLMALLAFFISCNTPGNKEPKTTDALAANIDSTIKPGDDFFMYANGKWFKEHPIPASEKQNGLWDMIRDTISAQVRSVCETSSADKSAAQGSPRQKIGDFFYTVMDTANLNKKGISDIQYELDNIDKVSDLKGLAKEGAYIQSHSDMESPSGVPFFLFYVYQDDKLSDKNAVRIDQGGLSMPDRRYFFDTDANASAVRLEFVRHVKNTFQEIGYDKAKAASAAKNLMELETAIAKTSRKSEDTRDPLKNYTKLTFQQLCELAPNFDFAEFMTEAGLPKVDSVIMGQPEFLTALNGYLTSFPLEDWKNYLKYEFFSQAARYMDDKTFMESFRFYTAALQGVKEPKPRWKRAVEQTNNSLGELIGQVYVSDYLPKGTKEKLLQIGNDVKTVYAERLKNLDWMSDATKEKALHKLSVMLMKVGYPDKWKDMSNLQIDRTSYVKNVLAANHWAFDYMIKKYGKPVDRTEWSMEPQTYDAYYNPSNNELVVPGCNIIIPGYEHAFADDALLYSVIGGSTFGHEMTHGFDDQGSKYDEKGNLHNWWTVEDSAKFYGKTKMIVKQFNRYIAVDNLHINGENTQGENIADLGGVNFGFEAFKKTKQFTDNEMLAGLTPTQRYFLGWAYSWMINVRPQAIANMVRSNVHSPPQYRTNGPVSNMSEFYTAFHVEPGDKMYRSDSVRVRIC